MANTADDLGFVPDSQIENSDDLGFVPQQLPTPNMAEAKKALTGNIQKDPKVHEAHTFLDDWLSGWQQSVTSLGITKHALPDTVLPEDADRFARIISMAGQLAGDAPAMLAGAIGGGAAGGAIAGSPGAKIGANVGAFALPAAIRSVLIDHYKKGDIQNFSDFYDRASGAFLESLKAGVTGAAVGTAGLAVGKLMPLATSPLLKLGATTAAEGATMVTVGKAMDGKVPQLSDFTDTALMLGALHLATGVAEPISNRISSKITNHIENKLMDVYAETGLKPHETYDMAAQDQVLRQELLSDDKTIPNSLKPASDSQSQPDPHTVEINPNPELTQPAPSLSTATKNEDLGQLKVQPISDAKNPSMPEEIKGEEPKRTDAESAILSRIGEPDEEAPSKYTKWNKFMYNFVDKYDPIKLATKALSGEEILGAKDDPYALARTIQASGRRAEAAIENGPADFNTGKATGTPALKDILEPFKEDLNGFRAFAVASRAVELAEQGKKTGMPLDQAREVVNNGEYKYKKGFQQFVQFQNDILKYGKDSGLLSQDAFSKMVEMNKSYVSFKRVMGADEGSNSGNGQGLSVFTPGSLKKLEGSERQILDPIASSISNTQSIISLAEKNRAMLTLTDMLDKAENPELGQKVTGTGQLKANQVVSFKDGERQVYEVSKELAASVKQMDDGDVSNLTKIISIPARSLRLGMIGDIGFAAKHFIRQEQMSMFFAKDQYIPVWTTLKGLGGLLSKSDEYYDWLRAGGADGIAEDLTEKYGKIFDLNEETGFLDKGFNTIKSASQGLPMITRLLDEARLLGKYQSGIASGKDSWQAAFDSRDSAIDSSRVGAQLRAWNMITPFENMRIQGLDVIRRNFQENPLGTTTKLVSSITLPSVLLWYANHQDDRWQDIPRYVKDTSYIFMTKDHIFRVPKPFEPGVMFGSLPERTLEKFFTDIPRAFKDFTNTMLDSAMPQYMPAAFAPILEQYSNKSLLTGNPLISDHMQKVLPEYQSNPYTSDTAKIIAGALRMIPTDLTNKPGSLGSPIIIDNYVHSWGGNLGQYFIQATDASLEKMGVVPKKNDPEKTLADIPFIKAFVVRYPSSSPQGVGDFYDRFEKTQARLNTIEMLGKQGDFKSMQKEMASAQVNHEMINLGGYKTAISQQLQLIQKIYQAPDMTPHEKRQQIDKFYMLVINEVHRANQILDGIDKNGK